METEGRHGSPSAAGAPIPSVLDCSENECETEEEEKKVDPPDAFAIDTA